MFKLHRHCAYNVVTGEIKSSTRSNHLKRWVARDTHYDRKHYHAKGAGQWRFCHDFGKRWEREGFPVR